MATSPARRRPRLPSPDIAADALLESLPPAMLDEILSRLPIRDAARTSVLSRAWRRRWESIPYLLLNWPRATPSASIEAVLSRCTTTVREFCHPYVREPRRSDLWLLRLVSVGVQSLVLTFPRFPSPMIHSCVFSCSELVVLDLGGCDIPCPPPSFTGFPNLTTLSLSHVAFPQGVWGLVALISLSGSLQTLRLQHIGIPPSAEIVCEQWIIRAPNLQNLVIISMYDYGLQINDLPSLEEAAINFRHYWDGRGFMNLISRLDHVKKLELSMPFTRDNVLDGLSRSFGNLKSLLLYTHICFPSSMLAIFCLVSNAPKLEVLDIELSDYVGKCDEVDIDFLNAQWVDDLFSNLRSVCMKNAICESNEMVFIAFILSKARQIEVFSVHQSRRCLKSEEDTLAELAHYRRASPGVNVVVRSTRYKI